MPILNYNLQFFQGEKTEQATPKKRKEARDKGQVVQSRDINTAIVLIVVFIAMNMGGEYFSEEFLGMFTFVFSYLERPQMELSVTDVMSLSTSMIWSFTKIALPLLVVAMLTGTVLSYMQVGFLFTVEPLQFKLSKINPLSGLKRMFSTKSLVELLKAIFKSIGILVVSYLYVLNREEVIIESMTYELPLAIATLWDTAMGIIIRTSIFLLVISVFDYVYKLWENNKELKMSKQEIKDEYKQVEGDPLIKSKIKEKQRELAMSRMMQEVPKADVIITNPSH